MALGARSQDVLQLVMRESMIMVAIGVAIGIAIALGTGRFVFVAALRVAAHRRRVVDGGDAGDDYRVSVRRIPARPARVTRRSDGSAASRVMRVSCELRVRGLPVASFQPFFSPGLGAGPEP